MGDAEKNERRADDLLDCCVYNLCDEDPAWADKADEAAELYERARRLYESRGERQAAEIAREKGVVSEMFALCARSFSGRQADELEERAGTHGLSDPKGERMARAYHDDARAKLAQARALAGSVPNPAWDRFAELSKACLDQCEWGDYVSESFVKDYEKNHTLVAQQRTVAAQKRDAATRWVPLLALILFLDLVVPVVICGALMASEATAGDVSVGVCLMVASASIFMLPAFIWWASDKTRLGCFWSLVVFTGAFMAALLVVRWVTHL